jgi:hypothetical protein
MVIMQINTETIVNGIGNNEDDFSEESSFCAAAE